jgi:hypothetical protein
MPKPGLTSRSDCDYYQGVGICSFGCWEEPTCKVDEPPWGWLAQEAATASEQAWEERGRHGRVKYWRDVMRHFGKRDARRV